MGTPSNTFTFISQYFSLLFTWGARLLSWINKLLELFVEYPGAELHYRHFTMQLIAEILEPRLDDSAAHSTGRYIGEVLCLNTKNIGSLEN